MLKSTYTMQEIEQELFLAKQKLVQYEKEHEELEWIKKLASVPSKHLSPSQKWVLVATRWHIDESPKKREDGLTRVYLPVLGEKIGISGQTVGDAYLSMKKSGIIDHKTERITGKDQHTSVGLPDNIISRPDDIRREVERKHGGDRICKHCGGKEFRKYQKTIITCKGCGLVHEEKETNEDIVSETHIDENTPVFEMPVFEETEQAPPYVAPTIAGDEPLTCPGCYHAHREWWRWVDIKRQWECLICGAFAPGRIAS